MNEGKKRTQDEIISLLNKYNEIYDDEIKNIRKIGKDNVAIVVGSNHGLISTDGKYDNVNMSITSFLNKE
jgi:hypothetical protein